MFFWPWQLEGHFLETPAGVEGHHAARSFTTYPPLVEPPGVDLGGGPGRPFGLGRAGNGGGIFRSSKWATRMSGTASPLRELVGLARPLAWQQSKTTQTCTPFCRNWLSHWPISSSMIAFSSRPSAQDFTSAGRKTSSRPSTSTCPAPGAGAEAGIWCAVAGQDDHGLVARERFSQ